MRRRYHFGLPGLIFIGVTLLLAVGASNSQNNLLFLAFSIAMVSAIASGFISGAMMMNVEVERILPNSAVAGVPATFRYQITNRHRLLPVFALIVEERPEKAAHQGWRRHLPPLHGAVLHLPPGESIELPITVTPTRRGVATFHNIRLWTSFPFGLVKKSATFTAHASLTVLPGSPRLRRDAADALLSQGESGLTSSPAIGRGDEFFGVRDYVPGDASRLISWRATARTGAIVVREHTSHASGSLWIVLNLASTPNATPIEPGIEDDRAVSVAAGLIDAALAAGLDVGLYIANSGVAVAPGAAPKQRHALMHALARSGFDASEHQTHNAESTFARAAAVVVHAGPIDPRIGPPGAAHISSQDLESLIAERLPTRDRP